MIDGHPFLYQAIDGVVYHVADDVTAVASWSSIEPIIAFVDGDNGEYAPNWFLRDPCVQIIMASSPKGTQHRWLKQAGHLEHVAKLAADLWSPREFYLTGFVLFFV